MGVDTIVQAQSRALTALKPPLRMSLGDWMESHMRLPEGVSDLYGRVTLWPYQRGIAEAINDPLVETYRRTLETSDSKRV